MLTLEINKNEVERARLVKEANFPVFLCTAEFNFIMHGSILPVTMPPLGILPGICNFVFIWRSIPPPGTQKETIPHPWDSSSTTNTLFCVQSIDYDIDFRTIAKPDVLIRT